MYLLDCGVRDMIEVLVIPVAICVRGDDICELDMPRQSFPPTSSIHSKHGIQVNLAVRLL